MDANYMSGFLHGFFAAMAIGFVLGQMSRASNTWKQKNKPLDTFPDAMQPNTTPAKIVRKSNVATFLWVFWLFVLLIAIVVVGLPFLYQFLYQ